MGLGWVGSRVCRLAEGFESGLPDAEDAKVAQRTQKKAEKNTKISKLIAHSYLRKMTLNF
jgi:hypothetical protein